MFGIPNKMTLGSAVPSQNYQIIELNSENLDDPRLIRLKQFGFIQGTKLQCVQLSPWLKNPILVEIRGMKIALTKAEGELVSVKVLK
jgi:Fe2+ transport system protein FeoA